ncbi:nucleotidyl transferase AbiEii/AbiGii toxin family protein [Candidatus Uhrbacteria bacterium]|nr:nucleotidyl transferase AbiEii/AbiGii toxin family protein [Candidatus Uhrbacteria bacterium]
MVARISKQQALVSSLHFSVVPPATRRALGRCAEFSFLKKNGWYLAGGTALALQVGHRQSVDLDFFTPRKYFSEAQIEHALTSAGKWKTTLLDKGTLYGELDRAKMSFIAYPFFHPTAIRAFYGLVGMVVPADIAVMKIIAISQRGRKRDFLDLYWLCTHGESLSALFRRVTRQYPQDHNIAHIIKSLTYFDDAEADPMPPLFFKATWTGIKSYFRREVPRLARELLRLD